MKSKKRFEVSETQGIGSYRVIVENETGVNGVRHNYMPFNFGSMHELY
jgi:hypothetical protein